MAKKKAAKKTAKKKKATKPKPVAKPKPKSTPAPAAKKKASSRLEALEAANLKAAKRAESIVDKKVENQLTDAFVDALGQEVVDTLLELGLFHRALKKYGDLTSGLPGGAVPSEAQIWSIVEGLLQPGVKEAIAKAVARVFKAFIEGSSEVKRGRTAHA